jgi:hypothetical protein
VTGMAPDVRAAGERVEALLAELGPLAPQAEELVRALVELYGAGLDRVMEIVTEAGSPETLRRLVDDDLVSGLLIVHDLHPLTTAERVEAALSGHQSEVELLRVTPDGVVRLRAADLHGCRSHAKDTVERAIRAAAPEVSGVEFAPERPLLQIGPRPPGPPGPPGRPGAS